MTDTRDALLGSNLALGKTAAASSVYSNSYSADKAVDGNANTRWAMRDGVSAPQSLTVDLGGSQQVNCVRILEWTNSTYPQIITGFEINVSMDNRTWETAFTGTTVSDGLIDFPPVAARYVQLNITAMRRTASVFEFEVYARQTLGNNLALRKNATASSVYSSSYSADKAVDGDASTRWAMRDGVTAPQNLVVDLGATAIFDYIHIDEWLNSTYPDSIITSFEINVSKDKSTWKLAYHGTTVSKEPFPIELSAARYIRLNITGMLRTASVREFEVYRSDDGTGKLSLKQLIDRAEALNSQQYTPESWTAVEAALQTARTVFALAGAAQDVIDQAVIVLYEALDALVFSAERVNLALGKAAGATSVYNTNYAAAKAVDGDDSTRWAMANGVSAPQSITIDLAAENSINEMVLKEWTDASYPSYIIRGYTIAVSADQQSWQTVQVGRRVGQRLTLQFSRVQARYVRVTITSMLRTASLYEIEVYSNAELPAVLPHVTDVAQLQEIIVPLGTPFSRLSLPETVAVTIDGVEQRTVPVVWDESAYKTDAILTFSIPGELQLPAGVENPLGLQAVAKVIVTGEQDEYDRLREKYLESLVGNGNYDLNADYIREKLSVIDGAAGKALNTMNTGESIPSLWPGSDYSSDLRTTDLYINQEYGKLKDMAVAYKTRGSAYYGDSHVRDRVLFGMRWLQANKYNPSFSISGGHGFRKQIGTPMTLMQLVTLMYGDLSQEEVGTYITTFDHYSPDPTIWIGSTSTGANRSNQCQNVVVRGIVGKNSAKIMQGVDALDVVFVYAVKDNTDGFYADGSFIQHTYYAYTGNYGKGLLRDATLIIYLLNSSRWEVTTPNSTNIFDWVFKAFNPLIHRANIFDDSLGRMLVFDGNNRRTADEITSIIVQLSRVESEQKPALLSAAKSMLEDSDTYVYNAPLPNVIWGQEILDDATIPARGPLEVYMQYARMDFAAQQRPGYGVGISMHSRRMANYEITNNNNLKGWHQGDGWTQVILPDFFDTYNNFYWQTVDNYRLPGTTANRNTTYANGRRNSRSWVGGVQAADRYGVTGMDLNPNGQSLEAKKSWFLLDQEVVCLGAGINSSDGKVVETTIENRMIGEAAGERVSVNGVPAVPSLGDSGAFANVAYAYIQGLTVDSGCGYVFPEGARIQLLREARSGSAKDVNGEVGISPEVKTRNYVTMWLEHGENPANETYAYILLPGADEAAAAAYSAACPVTVLSNTAAVQAVAKERLGVLAANFWKSGAAPVAGITCDSPASVMLLEQDGVLEVAVSDPTQQNTGIITVVIDRAVRGVLDKDSAVSAEISPSAVTVRVSVSGAYGAANKIWFSI